ncbi:Uncharacterized protein dnm_087110 [Desulfonema magnum]|uniref:Uncharacterized protein n=1 Tax=Desulfonema magnum TaxID=45655 RepID=A0A975GT21_9BACT|nr:Uncharacterized protein dnm_087110 [Desulfonema magnum]
MSLPGISGKSLNPMSYSRASPESVIIRVFDICPGKKPGFFSGMIH